jgi:hypothetical protein
MLPGPAAHPQQQPPQPSALQQALQAAPARHAGLSPQQLAREAAVFKGLRQPHAMDLGLSRKELTELEALLRRRSSTPEAQRGGGSSSGGGAAAAAASADMRGRPLLPASSAGPWNGTPGGLGIGGGGGGGSADVRALFPASAAMVDALGPAASLPRPNGGLGTSQRLLGSSSVSSWPTAAAAAAAASLPPPPRRLPSSMQPHGSSALSSGGVGGAALTGALSGAAPASGFAPTSSTGSLRPSGELRPPPSAACA